MVAQLLQGHVPCHTCQRGQVVVSAMAGKLADGQPRGNLADRLLRAARSATFVGKLMQTIGLGGAGVFLLQLPGAGSITAAVILTCFATGSLAFCFAGFAPNSFDIAPRYADVIWGLSNTFATIPGIVGVFVTGWLVQRTGSYAAPFRATAGIAFLGMLTFLAIASGDRQID